MKGNSMTLREALDKFLSYSKHGSGGRNEEKGIKDKGEFANDTEELADKRQSYTQYDDVRLQNNNDEMDEVSSTNKGKKSKKKTKVRRLVDDSEVGGVGQKPSKLGQGF